MADNLNEDNQEVFVSIIMPIRNEAEFIERAIQSILANDYPADKMEIIVVDGMSDDGTRRLVEEISREHPSVRMLDNLRRIVPTALNIGLEAARGNYFIPIGGHAEVPSDFVSESIKCLNQHPEAWVVGGYIETVAKGFIGKSIAAAMQSPVGVGNAMFRLGDHEGYVDTLAFGAHRRSILDEIGYFDEELVRNQDDDFNLRITMAGGKIWMSRSIRSKYFARTSLSKLLRQYYQYGFWRLRTLQKHKKTASFRQIVPLLFVGSVIALGLAGIFWRLSWCLLAVESGLYIIGLIAGAVGVGMKSGWKYALLAPVIFAILHFSYGLGSLWGIVRFILLQVRGTKDLENMKMSR